MLVSAKSAHLDRRNIDDKARDVVLGAYREACRTKSHAAFDAALSRYQSRYPHISKEIAGHAVAHILATAGM